MQFHPSYRDHSHPDHFDAAFISKHRYRALLDQNAKMAREVSALRKLLLGVVQQQPMVIEARELRASGYTFADIAARTGLTRNVVAAIIGQDGAA